MKHTELGGEGIERRALGLTHAGSTPDAHVYDLSIDAGLVAINVHPNGVMLWALQQTGSQEP